MITLNDYLYSGDTVLKILKKYTEDLRQSAAQTGNEVDVRHCEFLSQIMELQERLNCFRDLIAYRIVISMPKCHLKNPEDGEREEIRYLYETANVLKGFLEERGFTAEPAGGVKESDSPLLSDAVRPYYRDYIAHVDPDGYRSLHITFFDNSAKCYMEMQLRTKRMSILQRSDPPIIWGMRKSRRATGREGMPSLRGNVSTLMKPTSAAGDCTNSSLQSWMSICLRQSTTASSMTGAGCTVAG